jgi:hypothetical protein
VADKRYQVFVSSTYRDLKEERQAVIRALLSIGCIPSGMELFPADDTEVWEVIQGVISDCDYYVLVVGGRYGSLDDAGISYTQKEYEYATSIGRPVIAFLHRDPEGLAARDFELEEALRLKLDGFRATVRHAHTIREWSTVGELEAAVVVAVQHMIKSRPAVGWVRASEVASIEELAELRGQVLSLTAELNRVSTLSPEGTDDLADGTDLFQIAYSVRYRPDRTLAFTTAPGAVDLDWNQIFASLGPLMLFEAAETKLVAHLANSISRRDTRELGSNRRILVDADSFDTIKVQLLSLALIEPSSKRHGVHDTEAYWSLTPRGRTRLLQLRAVRRLAIDTPGDSVASPTEPIV